MSDGYSGASYRPDDIIHLALTVPYETGYETDFVQGRRVGRSGVTET